MLKAWDAADMQWHHDLQDHNLRDCAGGIMSGRTLAIVVAVAATRRGAFRTGVISR